MYTFTFTPAQEEEYRHIIQTVLDKKLDPIETAREFGVDIEQLRHMRQLNPTTRLRYLDAMAELIFIGRASIKKQREMFPLQEEGKCNDQKRA